VPKPQYADSFFGEPEPKPKKRAAPKPRKKAEPKPEPAVSPAVERFVAETEAEKTPVFQTREASRDWDFEDAIKALAHADMLHPDSLYEHAAIIDPYHNRPTLRKRVKDWKEQHAERTNQK
jgi:hypothetical protein